MIIEESFYKKIIQVLPIICVDIIIKNKDGRYLLVKRNNEPLKDEWWVVGGRIHHNETVEDAARRKVFEEAGITPKLLNPIGYFDGIFNENSFGVEGPYHAMSIVFETTLDKSPNVILDQQSSEWMWSDKLPSKLEIHYYSN